MSAELRTKIEAGDLHFLDGLVLLGTIASQRWFGGKSRDVLDARVLDAGIAAGRPADPRLRDRRGALRAPEPRPLPPPARLPAGRRGLARIRDRRGRGLDGLRRDRGSRSRPRGGRADALRLDAARSTRRRSTSGAPTASRDRAGELASIRPMGAEQSNSSVVLDERLALKLYRRIEPGVNPELEILRFLTERGFEHIAALEGYAAYTGRPLETTLALAAAVRALARRRLDARARHDRLGARSWLPARARRLGEVTARLHNALGSDPSDPHFSPEEPSSESLALLSASIDEEIEGVFATLPDLDALTPLVGRGEEVRDRLRLLTQIGNVGKVIRHHGDFHLGQALWTKEERLADPRLRGRARAQRARAAAQALALARRRGDAALVRLCSVGLAAPAWGRAAGALGGGMPHGLPRGLPRDRRRGAPAGRRAGDRAAADGLRAREGGLRAALRARTTAPTGSGSRSPGSSACWRPE